MLAFCNKIPQYYWPAMCVKNYCIIILCYNVQFQKIYPIHTPPSKTKTFKVVLFLPLEIRQCQSLNTFKVLLKTHFFQISFLLVLLLTYILILLFSKNCKLLLLLLVLLLLLLFGSVIYYFKIIMQCTFDHTLIAC